MSRADISRCLTKTGGWASSSTARFTTSRTHRAAEGSWPHISHAQIRKWWRMRTKSGGRIASNALRECLRWPSMTRPEFQVPSFKFQVRSPSFKFRKFRVQVPTRSGGDEGGTLFCARSAGIKPLYCTAISSQQSAISSESELETRRLDLKRSSSLRSEDALRQWRVPRKLCEMRLKATCCLVPSASR